MKLVLNIEPKPLSRAKFARQGKFTRVHYGPDMKKWRNQCRLLIANLHTGQPVLDGDIVKEIRHINYAFNTYVGIVKYLEGSWVVNTGNELIRLWTEVDENHVLGNIYENP